MNLGSPASRPRERGGCSGELSFGSAGRACPGPSALLCTNSKPHPHPREPEPQLLSLSYTGRWVCRSLTPNPGNPVHGAWTVPHTSSTNGQGRVIPCSGQGMDNEVGGRELELCLLARSHVKKSHDPGCVLTSSEASGDSRTNIMTSWEAEGGSATFRAIPRTGSVEPHAHVPTESSGRARSMPASGHTLPTQRKATPWGPFSEGF